MHSHLIQSVAISHIGKLSEHMVSSLTSELEIARAQGCERIEL